MRRSRKGEMGISSLGEDDPRKWNNLEWRVAAKRSLHEEYVECKPYFFTFLGLLLDVFFEDR
jgi:hypothetical protein